MINIVKKLFIVMKISLIIPTAFTPEPYFSRCMKRVQEEMEGYDFEVIISEDGNIPNEMKQYYPPNAIVLEHEKPSGCGLARKRAIEISTGDIITFLDSDDLICRGYYNTIVDNGPNTEYYFINVEPNGYQEIIDTRDVKYGHFSHEMVWNKSYDGPSLRKCINLYNPPLMMTPAEDLLMNAVYLGENDFTFKQIPHTLLTRYVRTNGLAWSTAADDRNRLKQMEVSIEYMKTHKRNEDVYLWVHTYSNIIEQRCKQQKGISGYKWVDYNKYGHVNEYISLKLTDKCNEKCSYCANTIMDPKQPLDEEHIALKTEEALDKWNELYGLPNTLVFTGGEPTLINVKHFLPLFDKYNDKTFLVYTNGYHLDEWMKEAPDNVLFKLHLVDEKVPLKYINNPRIVQMIIISSDLELKEKVESIKCPALCYITDHEYKLIDSKMIDKCRQVPGVYVIDVFRDNIVYPCCGHNEGYHGTIENLPNKKDVNTCSTCRNACDNVMEL